MTDDRHWERHGHARYVHHIVPFRTFVDEDRRVDYDETNALDNLGTLCVDH